MADPELTSLRTRLGSRYHVERLLGRGGMGAVYLARELRLDRSVALKVLPEGVAHDVALRDRFLRESRLAASFSHPNIVPVYAVEEQDDLLAFAMGYIEGESLAERVARNGPLTAREAVRMLQDVSYALGYAHARGVVHRDIKPDNIMIERATGRALVMDFGIARRTSTDVQPADGLTRVGEVVGTAEYMSPEQATGDAIDGRSDLYSLGLVAWFALTGRTAMAGGSTQQVLVRQLTTTLPSIASDRADLPSALVAVIDRCVAKEPAQRFDDAAALVEALEQEQLGASDIPLAVRLLANELGTIGLVVAFTTFAWSYLAARVALADLDNLDALMPFVVLGTIVLARLGQTLAEARRLSQLGFDRTAVFTGLHRVIDEAEGVRAAARVDPRRQQERRRTVRTALLMLVIGIVSYVVVLALREPYANGARIGPLGAVIAVSGVVCLSVAFVLWLRSPMRMPVGERAFVLFWLHGPGRWLIAWAVGRPSTTAARGTTGVTQASRAGAARVVSPSAQAGPANNPGDQRLSVLESRVDALESWRRAQLD